MGRRKALSSATIERWFAWYLALLNGERSSRECPQILGIDEHFFSRRHGYATTFCDLKNHKIHDVVLGRSEATLKSYLTRLEGKDRVQLVCMDLAPGYRALVKQHFSAGAHRSRSLSCHPYRQSSFPGLLEGTLPGGSQEPRPAFVNASASA